jgi:hypothetical protein
MTAKAANVTVACLPSTEVTTSVPSVVVTMERNRGTAARRMPDLTRPTLLAWSALQVFRVESWIM